MVHVDGQGAAIGPVRRLTSPAGHVSAYDVEARDPPAGSATPSILVVARDDGEAVDGSGGALLRVRVTGDGRRAAGRVRDGWPRAGCAELRLRRRRGGHLRTGPRPRMGRQRRAGPAHPARRGGRAHGGAERRGRSERGPRSALHGPRRPARRQRLQRSKFSWPRLLTRPRSSGSSRAADNALVSRRFRPAFLSTTLPGVAFAARYGRSHARSRAIRAHSSIGQSPRLITGLFLVRTQVGPPISLAPLAARATADAPGNRRPARRGGVRLRLKRPRALCTSVTRFLHRPGVTH